MFQVIPPCGGIQVAEGAAFVDLCVSSHTPLRGYSRNSAGGGTHFGCFKSYPLAGVFGYWIRQYTVDGMFQVIPPCGGIPNT